MKKLTIFTGIFAISLINAQYIGINTTEPSGTLDVVGTPNDKTKADGIILPKLTLEQLNAKTSYSTAQTGALIYITDITGGSTVPTTAKVTAVGRYYFDGVNWQSPFNELVDVKPEITSPSLYQNTYIFGAGNANNTGIGNTANGKSSLSSNEEGSNNSAFGDNALSFNEKGSDNTALGANSGTLGDFSYTIAIGSGAKATKNNQIVIGSENNTETVLFGNQMNNGVISYKSDVPNENYFMADAGRLDTTDVTGNSNIGIGTKVFRNLTTGVCNVAIGLKSLEKLEDGSDNTAIGAGVLQELEFGIGNTGMGRLALSHSVTGTNNTAIGDTALEFSLGSQNTAVGYSAGIKAVSGNFNSLFGVFAGGHYEGKNGPDGSFSYCNVFGAESMVSNVSGSNNNLFGYRAAHIATGGDNAGFGHEVFRIMTAGTRNTAFGNESGWRLTTGTDNTFLGYKSGQNYLQKADVIGSTVLGAYAYSTRDNEIVIGKETDTHVTIMGVEFTKDELIALKTFLSGL